MKAIIKPSIFAGLLIGIGGLTYLNVGGIAGAVLFAFGLMCVVMCKSQLFTGKAGFLPLKEQILLLPMLIANGIGCFLTAIFTIYSSNPQITETLEKILSSRQNASPEAVLITGIGTGIIMSLAVYGAQRNNYLPLLFGVPTFILCGLPHCVADIFYYAVAIYQGECHLWMLAAWIMAVIGNYIGCNIPRFFIVKD